MNKGTKTTSRKGRSIEQRAQAIIKNTRRYDSDKRAAIQTALKHGDADLAECVRRAERGETILDISRVQAEYERAAQYVIDMYTVERVPDFLTDAITVALSKAAVVKGIEVWQPDGAGGLELSRRSLADLFALTQMLGFDVIYRQSLAEQISAILKHPKTPAELYNAIGEAITSMGNAVDFDSPAYIAQVLEAYEASEKGGQS